MPNQRRGGVIRANGDRANGNAGTTMQAAAGRNPAARPNLRDTAIYALTRRGAKLGHSLAARLGGALFVPEKLADLSPNTFQSIARLSRESFHFYRRHVFICAAGIVVRCIADLIGDKGTDPAVVVMDQDGRYAVSLLAGHLGGANELARECAEISGGQAVITTATDTVGIPAIDMVAQDLGLRIANLSAVKYVSSALLDGRAVQILDPDGWLELPLTNGGTGTNGADLFDRIADAGDWVRDTPGVVVSWREAPLGHADGAVVPLPRNAVLLRPPSLALGVGCKRGTSADVIAARMRETLRTNGLSPQSVGRVGTVEAKRTETGLLQAAMELDARLMFFEPEQLAAVDVPNPSDTPLNAVGTPSVAEAAALLMGHGPLLVQKTAADGVTVAVSLMDPHEARSNAVRGDSDQPDSGRGDWA